MRFSALMIIISVWLVLVITFLSGIDSPKVMPVEQRQQEPATDAVTSAAMAFPGVNIHKSERHVLLEKLAQEQADSQARRMRQDHDGFDRRANIIRQSIHLSASEVCAESWKWQADLPPFDLWMEMYKCWRQSPGHWGVVSKEHKYWGCGIAKGNNGIWYSCILAAD